MRFSLARPLPRDCVRALLAASLLSGAQACHSSAARANGAAPNPCQLVERGLGPTGTVPVRAEVVVSGLEVPWGIAFLNKDELLVTERPGRVRLVRRGHLEEAS